MLLLLKNFSLQVQWPLKQIAELNSRFALSLPNPFFTTRSHAARNLQTKVYWIAKALRRSLSTLMASLIILLSSWHFLAFVTLGQITMQKGASATAASPRLFRLVLPLLHMHYFIYASDTWYHFHPFTTTSQDTVRHSTVWLSRKKPARNWGLIHSLLSLISGMMGPNTE